MTSIEQLGKDKFGFVSSQAVIKSGENRGKRLPEKNGTWVCAGGFTYDTRQSEKSAHFSWAKTLLNLGNRVGTYDQDGVTDFYIFKNTMNFIQDLKLYVEENLLSETDDYIFFDLNGRIGVIYCANKMEESDNHCEQCRNELLLLGFNGNEAAPDFLCGNVGPTKFNRIISGDRNFEVINFENVKIYNSSGKLI